MAVKSANPQIGGATRPQRLRQFGPWRSCGSWDPGHAASHAPLRPPRRPRTAGPASPPSIGELRLSLPFDGETKILTEISQHPYIRNEIPAGYRLEVAVHPIVDHLQCAAYSVRSPSSSNPADGNGKYAFSAPGRCGDRQLQQRRLRGTSDRIGRPPVLPEPAHNRRRRCLDRQLRRGSPQLPVAPQRFEVRRMSASTRTSGRPGRSGAASHNWTRRSSASSIPTTRGTRIS